jgi:hypothetical protein
MKASELRLGNLITSDGEIFIVDEIRGDFVRAGALGIYSAGFHLDDYYIPLTEEWLLKFGFEKFGSAGLVNRIGYYSISLIDSLSEHPSALQIWTGTAPVFHISIEEYGYSNNIKYVHQLQNLYFALTGEELTVKEI